VPRSIPRGLGTSRRAFSEALTAEGFPNAQGYVEPIYRIPMFQKRIAIGSGGFPFNLSDRTYPDGLCPVAESMRDTHLLQFQPVSWDVDDEQVEMMIEAIHKVHRQAAALDRRGRIVTVQLDKMDSLCEQSHQHRVDRFAVDQKKLPSSPPFLDHAAGAHDPQHRLIGFHGAGADLAQSGVLEKKLAGAPPGFEAIAVPAYLAVADQNREVGGAVWSINRRRDVADVSVGRIVGDNGPKVIGRFREARRIGAAGFERMAAMPLLAITNGLLVVEPSNVAFGEKMVVEGPQLDTFSRQDSARCHGDWSDRVSKLAPKFVGDRIRADGNTGLAQCIFGARISQFLEAEDVRCGNGTRTAFANSCGKMFERPYAAASNDRDRNPGGDATQAVWYRNRCPCRHDRSN